jgi:hypothetical protein
MQFNFNFSCSFSSPFIYFFLFFYFFYFYFFSKCFCKFSSLICFMRMRCSFKMNPSNKHRNTIIQTNQKDKKKQLNKEKQKTFVSRTKLFQTKYVRTGKQKRNSWRVAVRERISFEESLSLLSLGGCLCVFLFPHAFIQLVTLLLFPCFHNLWIICMFHNKL